jgi:acetyltransferase
MTSNLDNLEPLFRPRSIQSARPPKRSQDTIPEGLQLGFPGPVYPVNPKLDGLLGLKAYPRLEDIPGEVDFVISAVPAAATFDLVEGAKAKGTKLIHFYTARFSETGRADAAEAERELQRRTKEAGIRVIGPNCMGVFYPKQHITFDPDIRVSNVGFSQSGSQLPRRRQGRSGLRSARSLATAMPRPEQLISLPLRPTPHGDHRRFTRHATDAVSSRSAMPPNASHSSCREARRPGHAAAASHTASLASSEHLESRVDRRALEVGSLNEPRHACRFASRLAGDRACRFGGAGGGCRGGDRHEAGPSHPPPVIRDTMREKPPHAWDCGNPIDASIIGAGSRRDAHLR